MNKIKLLIIVRLITALQYGSCLDGKDFTRFFKEEQQFPLSRNIPQYVGSKICYTQNGCACWKQWSFQGSLQEECANPDNDYRGNWCEIDPSTCARPDGQFQDSLRYYGYCECGGCKYTYVARGSEEMEQIAVAFGVQLQDLLNVNNFNPNRDIVQSGMEIFIPPCQPYALTTSDSSPVLTFDPTLTPITSPSIIPSPSPSPTPTPVSSQDLPVSTQALPAGSSVEDIEPYVVEITGDDCLTIINTGCLSTIFFMTFADGELIPSQQYQDYGYYQSSGWWALLNETDDYTRWCSPTGSIGVHIMNQENSNEVTSALYTPVSTGTESRCVHPQNEFDFLTYVISQQTADGHTGNPTFSPFYVDSRKGVRAPGCSDIGGQLRQFIFIPKNTTLYVNQQCELTSTNLKN